MPARTFHYITPQLIAVAAIACVALYLLVAAAKCALRLLALAVLVVAAILVWRWLM